MTKQHLAPFLWHNSLTSDKGENMCKDLLSPLHFLKYRHLCKVMSAQNSTKPTNNIIYQRWLHVKIHVPDITQNQDNPSECIHFALDVFVAIVGKPELSQTSLQTDCFDHVWNEGWIYALFTKPSTWSAFIHKISVIVVVCFSFACKCCPKACLQASHTFQTLSSHSLFRKTPIRHFSHS